MVNRYLERLKRMDAEHKRILDKLAFDHHLKIKQDEQKYSDL